MGACTVRQKNRLIMKHFSLILSMLFLLFTGTGIQAASSRRGNTYSLTFNVKNYKSQSVTFQGKAVKYRAYTGIIYVAHPVDKHYESMNIFIPEEYFSGKKVNGYTASTAPIFLPNNVGGYMPGEPGTVGNDFMTGQPNATVVALSRGLVVASPGARGRTCQNSAKTYTGKAPACIIDLKAAVRYLRHNDKQMPGDAEKIISNGTSAGGALSSLLGASGCNADYEPYLTALGAADERDDIFAVSAYCPITNLDHADIAYEWLFNGVNSYKGMPAGAMMGGTVPGGRPPLHEMPRISSSNHPHAYVRPPMRGGMRPMMPEVEDTLTPHQRSISDELRPQFTAYLNSLCLTDPQGNQLSLDADGNGSFRDYVVSFVKQSAQRALDSGTNLSQIKYLTISGGKVTNIDFSLYLQTIERKKTPPAFDALDLSSAETSLFGDAQVNARHFTEYGLKNSAVQSTLAPSQLVKIMNPMNYIGDKAASTAKHWRIRHGTADRDGSLAVPIILATRLQNLGYDVNFALPWNVPHSGDYDLTDLFGWIESITR